MNGRCHAGCKGRCWEDTARLVEVEGGFGGSAVRAEESQKETGLD